MLLFGIHDQAKEGDNQNKDLQQELDSGSVSSQAAKKPDNLKALKRQLTGGVVNHAGHKILSVSKDCLMCSDSGRAHN